MYLGINNANAWLVVDGDEASIECVDGNCYLEDERRVYKHKRPKLTTTYNKDPLAMPNEKQKVNTNDPMAMHKDNNEKNKDPMAF